MGFVKTLARSYVWWPSIDKQIDECAQNCDICSKFAATAVKTHFMFWEWPKEVWTRLHGDFILGQSGIKHLRGSF